MANGDGHADQSSWRGARLAIVLAWVGGMMDATGYLLHSYIFTAHMSGNSAALGSRWERNSARALIITNISHRHSTAG